MFIEVKEMKFSEKLQKLRKENKMSQEQLADQLEVSRQAVSKWESGQTYPEMDKLIAICKLFKCSLDDLTNDEIKEIKGNGKEKVTISKFLDEILDTISRSVSIFQKLSLNQKLKYLFGLLVLILMLVLIRIPVDYIYELGVDIFERFDSNIGSVLCSIWNFILSISYLIFSVICFYYLYKVLFLEKWESAPVQELKKEKKNFSNQDIKIKKESEKEETIYEGNVPHKVLSHPEIKTSVTLKLLNSILSFFVKLCGSVILFPFLFVFFFIVVFIILTLYFMFQGVIYFGVLFLLIGGFILCYLVIHILFSFIISRAQSSKQIGILFLSSLIILGIGTGITIVEFSSFTYCDKIPETELYNTDFADMEVEMTDDFYFSIVGSYQEIEYVNAEDLGNKVKFQVEFYSNFSKVNFEYETHSIGEGTNPLWIVTEPKVYMLNPNFRKLVFQSLKEHKVYNYGKLEGIKNVVVLASSENIDKIKENRKKVELERENSYCQAAVDNYQLLLEDYQQMDKEYQSLMNEKEIETYELKLQIETLEEELEETTTKLQEYKDQIASIITE